MALTKVSGSILKDPLNLGGEVSIGGTLTYQDVTNVDAIGIITARSGVNVSGGQLDVGSNIKLGNAGVVTATSFVGSGANLTSLPTQVNIANNADNRIITGGSGVNLNGEANLIFNGTELYPATGIGTNVGHRLNYRRNPPQSRTNTGSASLRYYKIGEIVLNGSESAEINIYGTVGYSAGQEVAGKTTIIMRATNGGTLAGFWYEESLGQINLSDVRWKYTGSNNVYELWVQANNYSNIAPFVRCTGNGYTSFNEDTGSTAPAGSTLFSTYNRKVVGTTATIRYNPTDTTFNRNIKMATGYGIDFSLQSTNAQQNSPTTDDEVLQFYEKGKWTPDVKKNNVSNATPDVSHGRYVRIGQMVWISMYVRWASGSNSQGTAGAWEIYGLPFSLQDDNPGTCRIYQFAPAGYFYINSTYYGNTNVTRWQVNNNTKFSLYTSLSSSQLSWNSGAMGISLTGCFMIHE